MLTPARILAMVAGFILSTASIAQVHISDAWARATVSGQSASGVFLRLKADADTRLVGASSAVAGITQLHSMSMKDHVMHMNPIDAIELPAGQTVALAAGGYHIMLMDLKQTLEAGKQLSVQMHFKDAQGKSWSQTIEVPIQRQAPAHGGMGHGHDAMKY
ncbi:MAG TPA: copper chaperone PCu(A)C [Burkholderiaceae bacterium]|nr:copper chaperone PCu(A)C [Burkholderiaceae bacterium]